MKRENRLGALTIILFLLIGIVSYKNVGVSWDEEIQRKTGEISYNYIFNNDSTLLNWQDRDYGVAFEVPLIIVEKIIDTSNPKRIYQNRHFVTYLFFLIGAFCFYLLIQSLFKNRVLALIGLLLYLLHPRIFADSFYNTKDIPFLSMYSICLYWTYRAFSRLTISNFIILGVFIGLLINMRLMGLLLFAIILFYLLIDLVSVIIKKNKEQSRSIKIILIFITSSILALYISWPFLWKNPIDNFMFAWHNMSKFRWDGEVLLGGKIYRATQLPWFYAPYWFSVTTPLFILSTGLLGIVFVFITAIKTKFKYLFYHNENRVVYIALGSFLLPIITIIILKSVLYDAWRQVFFIYPSFVVLCMFFLDKASKLINTKILYFTCFIFIGLIGYDIYQLNPLNNIYFNELLLGKEKNYLQKSYELDYWGMTYKKSIDYILEHDPSNEIKINGNTDPCCFNSYLLFSNSRIKYVSLEEADYFITNYRWWYRDDYPEFTGKEFHSITYKNSDICTIFKLK